MSRCPANQTAIPKSTLKDQIGFGYSRVRVPSGETDLLGTALRALEASGSLDFLTVGKSWAVLFGSMLGCPGWTSHVVCS